MSVVELMMQKISSIY